MRRDSFLCDTPQFKHVERDVAAETMSMIMVKRLREGASPEERRQLMEERMDMYVGDTDVIEKIMTVYANEILETKRSCKA